MTSMIIRNALIASVAASTLSPIAASAQSNPSVVVTVENLQPSRGGFLTPVWMGIHDGAFDIYDRNQPASFPLGGNEVEALAEDGNNAPISATFATLQPFSPQIAGLTGPAGPIAPGERAATTFNVDPLTDRYFSYGSMIIPSNDFFIANGNPLAHELFDNTGNFVGEGFTLAGSNVLDAGTEVNDEIAPNVAFLAQAAPNTGVSEGGVVTAPAEGFAQSAGLSFPNGVTNQPVFANANFAANPNAPVFRVSFQYVDLGRTVQFASSLSSEQEVGAIVDSEGEGTARLTSVGGQTAIIRVNTSNLTGPIVAAHLHLGAAGANGPVIVDLGNGIRGSAVVARIGASNLTNAFDGDFGDLLNELAAGNVYINIHTAANPAGEIRGQVNLAPARGRRSR